MRDEKIYVLKFIALATLLLLIACTAPVGASQETVRSPWPTSTPFRLPTATPYPEPLWLTIRYGDGSVEQHRVGGGYKVSAIGTGGVYQVTWVDEDGARWVSVFSDATVTLGPAP